MPPIDEHSLQTYFQDKLDRFGFTPRGVDWNSVEAQENRFAQLARVIRTEPAEPFTLLDYGSGFGALYDFLVRLGHRPLYTGFDFVPAMVAKGRETHPTDPNCAFTADETALIPVDFVIASGIFNIRLETSEAAWRDYVLSILTSMDSLAVKGFAFNMLTSYSDPEYMKSHLYYADPCFFFDYCKRHFSKSVALLHDYGLYDFTILVRK
jgi:SAM-dependent methyltransferase